ncbi:MAG TPA: hypothetical protein VE988_11965 [Gemmataceae bacterium]|nr:hypothetical protein [Gemmataceae bacterium]
MRWHFKVTIVLALGLALFGLAVAQQPLQIGNIRGLFAKDGRSDPVGLLKNRDVKNELKLSDEQTQKVEEAIWKILAESLDAEQVKRLLQIDFQQRDYKVFADPKIQAQLKFDDEQKVNFKKIVGDTDEIVEKLIKELEENNPGTIPASIVDKINAARKEGKQNCLESLTDEQRRQWREMLGEPFLFSAPKIDITPFLPKKIDPTAKKAKAKKGG